MVTKSIKLGPNEAKLLLELEKEDLKVFTFQEAKRILNLSRESVANVIHRLRKKKRIIEIEKGKYLLVPARAGLAGHWAEDIFLVVDKLLEDYYIGFLTAMHFWNLTEQIPNVVLVATTKRKRPLEFNSQKIRFITLTRRRFFGFIEMKTFGYPFKISSLEKTIVDGLLYPQYCNGIREVCKALWNARTSLNWFNLLKILEELNVSSAIRRLGYLLEVLNLEREARELLPKNFKGFRWLDPSMPKRVKGYSKTWGLILNLTEEDLLSWRGS